jgi:hypothetical protein
MANTPSAFQQLLDRADVQSKIMQPGAIDNQRIRKMVASERPGRGLKDLADRVDDKDKRVKSLEKKIEDTSARFLKAERELSRVKGGLSEENRKRYEAGEPSYGEALNLIKDALQEDVGLLDGLKMAMPELPLPSSMMTVFTAAAEAKAAVSKLEPGLASLGIQIADVRNGLELLKAKMQEEANLRVDAAELEMVKQESSKLKSALEVRIQDSEAKLKRVEAKAEEYKSEASHRHALWLSLSTELNTQKRRRVWLTFCLAVERRKSSRLERNLQEEQRSKEVLVSATDRVLEFNSCLSLERDSITEELKGVKTSLEKATDTNGRLRTQLAASNSDRESLLEQMKEKAEELDQWRHEVHNLKDQVDKLRTETGARSEELRERAEDLTKAKSLADERRGEIERLQGEKRQLTDDRRIERTKSGNWNWRRKLRWKSR